MNSQLTIFLKAVADMRDLQKQLEEARKKNLQNSAKTIYGLKVAAEGRVDRMVAELKGEATSKEQVKMEF